MATFYNGSTILRCFALVTVLVLVLGLSPSLAQLPNGQVPIPGSTISKYVDPLPTFVGNRVDGTKNLTISAKEIQQQVLPAGYPLTTVWGYEINDGSRIYPANYPAFTIEAKRGIPTNITYFNELENQTLYTPVGENLPGILPVDQSIHWADPFGNNPMGGADILTTYSGPVPLVVHLHGGEVPSKYDGGPDAWFTPGFQYTGPAWNLAAADAVSNVYQYPNTQEAATIWYHDHALGLTRLNVYAGLAGFYFLRDERDNGLVDNALRVPAGEYEVEVAIQDRMFDENGQLLYPNEGVNPDVNPFWVPEFFGDVMVVNGKTWPYMQVEPRRYRFHFLDGSNARFYQMWLENAVTGAPGPSFWQIGTDGGLLNFPVRINPFDPVNPKKLLMGPGERADLIIDFTKFKGQTLTLRNDANAPFPDGDPADPQTVGQIMQFRVTKPLTGKDCTYDPAWSNRLRQEPLVTLFDYARMKPAVKVDVKRQLTLNEVMGAGGPLEVLVNNTHWGMDITENPQEGNTEVWEIINLTADAHPIHLHLVQYQLIKRQAFDVAAYQAIYDAAYGGMMEPMGPPFDYNTPNADGAVGGNPAITPFLLGTPRPAEKNEKGWKDTFVMYPGEVTTVIVRFAPTDLPRTTPKANLKFAFNPAEGPGYVWHCHIVDHEDNEMMRPYAVVANPSRGLSGRIAASMPVSETTPVTFGLSQNYPNPFNPSTVINYAVAGTELVQLKVFNILGQEVASLVNEVKEAGRHSATFDASSLAAGVYTYRLTAGMSTEVKRMLLVK